MYVVGAPARSRLLPVSALFLPTRIDRRERVLRAEEKPGGIKQQQKQLFYIWLQRFSSLRHFVLSSVNTMLASVAGKGRGMEEKQHVPFVVLLRFLSFSARRINNRRTRRNALPLRNKEGRRAKGLMIPHAGMPRTNTQTRDLIYADDLRRHFTYIFSPPAGDARTMGG